MPRLRRRLRVFFIRRSVSFLRRLIRLDVFWRLARRFKPVLILPVRRMVFVTRHDDVRDVLSRDRDFKVPYLPNLEGLRSPFLLGLPDGDSYARQRDVLWRALRDSRLPSIEAPSRAEAKRALVDANGTIDVVRELTERVLINTVGTYLGTGRGTPEQLKQSRAIFYEVFINALRNPDVIEEAAVAGSELRAHFAEVVADRRAAMQRNEAGPVDVLHLLLKEDKLTDDELVNSMLGLFVGWTGPVSRSMGFAVNVLLDKHEAMELAREAALADDLPAVGDVMREALRFYPSAPALERICARKTRIAGRRIRRNDQVMALLNSAMMDDTHVTRPREFTPARGEMGNLHFGSRLHRCVGERISMRQIQAISSVLLAHDVKRAGGRAGQLKYDGPYPSRLLVTLGPARP